MCPQNSEIRSNPLKVRIPWNKGKKGLQVGWNKGQHLSNETKQKISETRKLLFSSGKLKPYWKDKKKPPFSDEWKLHLSQSRQGKHHSEEWKNNIRLGQKDRDYSYLIGRHHSEETLKKLRKPKKSNLNYIHPKSSEHRKKISEARLKLWKNEEFAQKMSKIWGFKPTKPEIFLATNMDRWFPNEWKYVGNGKFWIDGKNPDFINCNGKKLIIEFNGKYWHQDKNEEIEREKHFAEYGFRTLFLNEDDLKDTDILKEKINTFMNEVDEKKVIV